MSQYSKYIMGASSGIAALLISACAGGGNTTTGGTGGTGGGGGGTTEPTSNSEIGTLTPDFDRNGTLHFMTIDAGDDKIEFDRLNNRFYLNGVELKANEFDVVDLYSLESLAGGPGPGYVSGVYTVNGDAKSFGATLTPDQHLEIQREFGEPMRFEKPPRTAWTYSGVSYGYEELHIGEAPRSVYNQDGWIRYDGWDWSAKFGDVSLTDGDLDGHNVSGKATLGDMSGEFQGYDAELASEDWTWGAFAGDDGEDSSFAGGWSVSGVGMRYEDE